MPCVKCRPRGRRRRWAPACISSPPSPDARAERCRSFTTGVDAVSYIGLGRVFTGWQTATSLFSEALLLALAAAAAAGLPTDVATAGRLLVIALLAAAMGSGPPRSTAWARSRHDHGWELDDDRAGGRLGTPGCGSRTAPVALAAIAIRVGGAVAGALPVRASGSSGQ